MRSSNDLLSNYLQSLQRPCSPTLSAIEKQLRADDKWGINIGSVEGQNLQFLIKTHRVRNILEIGTQYGYSTQWMLEALPSEGTLTSLEKDPEHHRQASTFIQDPRARFLLGDARELLKTLGSQNYDLIFIDANKKAYPEYLAWAETHVSSGGLIIGDNTFLFGEVFYNDAPEGSQRGLWQAMRLFNERLMQNPQFEACIVPTAEGLTVAVKK